jgi:hypothetical protein
VKKKKEDIVSFIIISIRRMSYVKEILFGFENQKAIEIYTTIRKVLGMK